MREVLKIEAEALAAVVGRVDESFLSALECLQSCSGKVVTTGMGKSGLVARKTASTLSSTGTLAVFLHPTEALHGDLGLVASGDVVLAFGKSGESDELASLLPALKRRGAKLIAVTGTRESTLAKAADIVVWVPVEREACPYDLAPTSSSIVAMAIGDALALTLMKIKNFRPDDFAAVHPGGRLGRRLNLTVGDLMVPLSQVKLLDPARSSMLEVLGSLSPYGLVLFSKDSSSLFGILTDGDVRRALEVHQDKVFGVLVDKIINKKPFSVDQQEPAFKALELMERRERPLNVVPVLDGLKLVGILRLHELVRVF
jgi:arabinose-5-phosphate isomerase